MDARFGADLTLGAVDGDGNVLIADSNNHRIVLLSPDGMVSLLVGQEAVQRCKSRAATQFVPDKMSVTACGSVVVFDRRSCTLLKVHAGLRPPHRAWQLGAPPSPLGDLLQRLLFNEELADVHFEVEGQSIPGHSQVRPCLICSVLRCQAG